MESSSVNADHDPRIGEQDVRLLEGLDILVPGCELAILLFECPDRCLLRVCHFSFIWPCCAWVGLGRSTG